MTMLERIAEDHRVPCKRTGPLNEDEKIIPGKWGHIWQDDKRLMIAYTDDGAKRALTVRKKSAAISNLGSTLFRITQNGEAEFCGEISKDHTAVERAIRVLGVRRFKITKGIPREFGLRRSSGGDNGPKNDLQR